MYFGVNFSYGGARLIGIYYISGAGHEINGMARILASLFLLFFHLVSFSTIPFFSGGMGGGNPDGGWDKTAPWSIAANRTPFCFFFTSRQQMSLRRIQHSPSSFPSFLPSADPDE
jgi:hypothetical protein